MQIEILHSVQCYCTSQILFTSLFRPASRSHFLENLNMSGDGADSSLKTFTPLPILPRLEDLLCKSKYSIVYIVTSHLFASLLIILIPINFAFSLLEKPKNVICVMKPTPYLADVYMPLPIVQRLEDLLCNSSRYFIVCIDNSHFCGIPPHNLDSDQLHVLTSSWET
jgi:hypothetical protein